MEFCNVELATIIDISESPDWNQQSIFKIMQLNFTRYELNHFEANRCHEKHSKQSDHR